MYISSKEKIWNQRSWDNTGKLKYILDLNLNRKYEIKFQINFGKHIK